jgi:DNA-binding MarR family transcriptional regulator
MTLSEFHKLVRRLRELVLSSTAQAGETPLTAGQLAIIDDIVLNAPTTAQEIVRRTALAQSFVSKTVAVLRAERFIQVAGSQQDGRQHIITLDPATRQMLTETRGDRTVESSLAEALPDLTPVQINRLNELLEELDGLLSDSK